MDDSGPIVYNAKFKPKPTTYRSVKFRSRLEARWACFFDLLEWPWEYEPFDCDGWAPDFQLIGAKESVLVEVKPVAHFPEDVAEKIEKTNPEQDVLIVGSSLIPGPNSGSSLPGPHLGWLAEIISWDQGDGTERSEIIWGDQGDGTERLVQSWGQAVFGKWRDSHLEIGFCHDYQSFHDRMSGAYNGTCGGDETVAMLVEKLWAEAGNQTRQQYPRKRQS